MKTQTNLVRRGNVYQFRKKVPEDLRESFGGRESIRESLRAFPGQVAAKQEAARRAAAYEQEFARIRESRLPRSAVPLTLELVPRLAQALEAHALAADEEIRLEGMSEEVFAHFERESATRAAELARAYARGDTAPVRHQLQDWLYLLGVEADPLSPEFRTLAREFLKASLRAAQGRTTRDRGELLETPPAPSVGELEASLRERSAAPPGPSRRPAKGPSLHDLVDYWKGTGSKAPRSVAAADLLVREFEKLHGPMLLQDIAKAHWIALRDDLLLRVVPKTVDTRFALLKAAYKAAMEDDQLGVTSSPLATVRVRMEEADEKPRDAFTVPQLQTLFDSQVFTAQERPEGGKGAAAFWAPLLALYTGARLDELLSLRTDSVTTWEGVDVIHIRHRPGLGQTLKSKAKNNRRVPIHPELIRIGFLDYVRGLKGSEWLFAEIDRSPKARSHSSAWGAWFGRYLARVGLKTDKLTFHSFRHTFKNFARASGIPEDHHDAITGHTTAEVARRYGSAEGYPVGALAESMERLQFKAGSDVLDLSRVHP